jgi:hypothetical protein
MDAMCYASNTGWIIAYDAAFPAMRGYSHSIRGAYVALVERFEEHAEVNATFHDELVALAAEYRAWLEREAS